MDRRPEAHRAARGGDLPERPAGADDRSVERGAGGSGSAAELVSCGGGRLRLTPPYELRSLVGWGEPAGEPPRRLTPGIAPAGRTGNRNRARSASPERSRAGSAPWLPPRAAASRSR